MFVHEAPYLGSAGGAGAQLRVAAVKLQNYADVNVGSKPKVLEFWESQKALADNDHGLPYDGVYVPGVADVRPACYKVLSHYRLFNQVAGKADFIAFVDHFILANGGATEPLVFSRNITGSNESDEAGTYVTLGAAYNNSCEVAGGKAPYTYQWKKRSGGVDANVGSNQATYNIPAVADASKGDYFVVVTDALGSSIESNRDRLRIAVRLTKNLAATTTIAEAATLNLGITAADGINLTYQWFKDDVAIAGRTSASFSKAAATPADNGKYHCVVTSANTVGPKTVKSVVSTVTVTPAPVEPEA